MPRTKQRGDSLPTEWLRDAKTPEEKKQVYEAYASAKNALRILENILLSRKASMPFPKEDDYKSPSWANLQAHRNGRIQECDWLLKLIQLDHE